MTRRKPIHWLVAVCAALLMGAVVPQAFAGQRSSSAEASAPYTGVVNLNTATAKQLDMLPGVGPAKAKSILKWRGAHKNFRRIEDLRRVKGFGRKTVAKLKPYLTVKGSTTFKSTKKGKAKKKAR